MRIFLGWPGRAELRARPALFFVVEGGGCFVVDLVELGVRFESRDDAGECDEVDDDQRPEGDSGVYLYPVVVDGHS